jgi:hypothetical protein
MEMSGQPHVSAAIPIGEIASDIRRIGGYVGLRYERDASERRKRLELPKIELIIPSRPTHRLFTRGAQIPCTRLAWRLKFVRWHLVVMGPQYGTCFTSSFWRLKFWGISYIFRQYRSPVIHYTSLFSWFQQHHHKQQEQRSNVSSMYIRILISNRVKQMTAWENLNVWGAAVYKHAWIP